MKGANLGHPILLGMRGPRGGSGGGGGPDPPGNLKSLISPFLLEMKKLVIFHICALPQLYVKQNQSTK